MKSFYRKENKILTELLYQMRVNSGLRQSDLADLLEVPQSYISKIESGERRVDILELLDICTAMNVDIADFIKQFKLKLNATKS